jgi:hypothetical protein
MPSVDHGSYFHISYRVSGLARVIFNEFRAAKLYSVKLLFRDYGILTRCAGRPLKGRGELGVAP